MLEMSRVYLITTKSKKPCSRYKTMKMSYLASATLLYPIDIFIRIPTIEYDNTITTHY